MRVEAAREALPDLPGVYKFLDARGEVIYVGKARNLRKRVLSYFTRAEDPACDYKTRLLVRHIAQIEWIVTDTGVGCAPAGKQPYQALQAPV